MIRIIMRNKKGRVNMKRPSYTDIRNNLIFTHHGRDNLQGQRYDGDDRTGISPHRIATCILLGKFRFAGHLQKKEFKGVTVLYRIDKSDPDNFLYIIITYYWTKSKNKYKKVGKMC